MPIRSLLILTPLLICCTACAAQPHPAPYMGETPPGTTPRLFEPAEFAPYLDTVPPDVLPFHSAVIFTPDGAEAYWTPMVGGHGILVSRATDGAWSAPRPLDLGLDHLPLDPFISPDGSRLYFLTRQHPETGGRSRERIWVADRDGDAWSSPRPLPETINALPTHWTFSTATSGNLYFNVDGVIHIARRTADGYDDPEPLPRAINDGRPNGCPCIAPDERFLVFNRTLAASDDLFVSFRGEDGAWTEAVTLGPTVNAPDEHDMSPRLTPDGRYLFFISRQETAGMYWVSADVIEELAVRRAVEDLYVAGVRTRDFGLIERLSLPDMTMRAVNRDGVLNVTTLDQWRVRFETRESPFRELVHSIEDIAVSGNAAHVELRFVLDGERIIVDFMHLLKVDGSWRLAHVAFG